RSISRPTPSRRLLLVAIGSGLDNSSSPHESPHPDRSGPSPDSAGPEPTHGRSTRTHRSLARRQFHARRERYKDRHELGTSRSEIWRLIQQLRELGVEIAGH